MFFETPRVTSESWHMLDGPYGAMCQIESKSNKSLCGTHVGMCHNLRGQKSKVMDKRIRGIQESQ